jgi:hypothetical protein
MQGVAAQEEAQGKGRRVEKTGREIGNRAFPHLLLD